MTTEPNEAADRFLQAASWYMKVESGDADREALSAWLADAQNASAWARVTGAMGLIDDHAGDRKMASVRQAAVEDMRRASRAKLPARWKMAIAAVLLAGVLGGGVYHWLSAGDDYRTAFGARRTVRLADGSRISLDSDSEVTVRYTRTARNIRLVKGQARFDVAHDVSRPFSVLARGEKVVATGTAFNIDITRPQVLVTLIQGRVVVSGGNGLRPFVSALLTASPHANPIALRAGQQLAAAPDGAPAISVADMRTTLAWTSGQLIFDNQPLADVVARVNHYARQPIVIADARLARLRISGSFNTGDIAGFLDIVTRYLPVERTAGTDGSITLREK